MPGCHQEDQRSYVYIEIQRLEDIVWSPGYSEVEGNEVADRLAKEAAVKAKAIEEETRVVTVQNIKRHTENVATETGYWGVW